MNCPLTCWAVKCHSSRVFFARKYDIERIAPLSVGICSLQKVKEKEKIKKN